MARRAGSVEPVASCSDLTGSTMTDTMIAVVAVVVVGCCLRVVVCYKYMAEPMASVVEEDSC